MPNALGIGYIPLYILLYLSIQAYNASAIDEICAFDQLIW
jgi:hypothetical protein